MRQWWTATSDAPVRVPGTFRALAAKNPLPNFPQNVMVHLRFRQGEGNPGGICNR
jgi:hypothetical protein